MTAVDAEPTMVELATLGAPDPVAVTVELERRGAVDGLAAVLGADA